jgi:hypothetical protein
MDSLNIPAQVITDDWTVIGWNSIVLKLFRDYRNLESRERNLFKILMLDERYRSDPVWFRETAKTLTARFKWDYSRTTQIAQFEQIIDEMLERSPMFREFWHESEIVAHLSGTNSVETEFGTIRMQHTSYAVEQAPSQRLMLFAPADGDSVEKLRLVTESILEPA